MKNIFLTIRLWYIYHFKMSEAEKDQYDQMRWGGLIKKNGKRINPKKFYIEH